MLPAEHRLRRSGDFTEVVRRGRRASRGTLTVHLLRCPVPGAELPVTPAGSAGLPAPIQAGLVVSKAVGGSVVRHRTARRLRHLLRAHVTEPARVVPAGSKLVVRAAPGAGSACSAELGADLAGALQAAVGPVGRFSAARTRVGR